MEAPEKIYIDKEGFYDEYWLYDRHSKEDVEYTRTDAFIDKACSGIEKLLSGYIIRNFHFGDSYNIDKLIEDFKTYMKGE